MAREDDDLMERSERREEFLFPTYPEDPEVVSAYRQVSVVNFLRKRDRFIDKVTALVRYQKRTLIIVTALCTAIGFFIALNTPQRFSAEAVLLPPTPDQVAPLNAVNAYIDNANTDSIDAGDVYAAYIANVRSREMKSAFYEENNIASVLHEQTGSFGDLLSPLFSVLAWMGIVDHYEADTLFDTLFDDALRVEIPTSNIIATSAAATLLEQIASVRVTVSLDGFDSQNVSKWLNDYLAFVDRRTVDSFISAEETRLGEQKQAVRFQINRLQQLEDDKRAKRLRALSKAYEQAQEFGITTPVAGGDDTALFLRGTDMLEKEIALLKSSDTQTNDIIAQEARLAALEQIAFVRQSVAAARIDKKAIPTDPYNQPNRFVLYGFLIGLLLSYLICSRSRSRLP